MIPVCRNERKKSQRARIGRWKDPPSDPPPCLGCVGHGERQQAGRHGAAVLPLVLQCLKPRPLHLRLPGKHWGALGGPVARAGTSPIASVSEHAANLVRRKGKTSYHSKHLHGPHPCSSSASIRRRHVNRLQFSAFNARKSSLFLTSISARPKRCLLYTSPSPRDRTRSRMPSSA